MIETPLFSAILLPIALGLIMIAMGLSLTARDFRSVFLHPKAVIIGLVAQMVLLPLIAFSLAWIPNIHPLFKVGIVLIAICPGGSTSNLINFLLNGNLALCVSLTTINSLLTQFTIPLLLNLALLLFMHDIGTTVQVQVPFGETMMKIFLITLLPTAIGILIRYKAPLFAEKARYALKYITSIVLGIAMLGAVFLEKKEGIQLTSDDVWKLLPLLVILNFGGMFVGLYLSRRLALGKKTAMTIAVEVGLQNTGMAITIAMGSGIANAHLMAVPAAIYALFTFFTAVGFGWVVSGQKLRVAKLFSKGKEK